MSFIFLSHSSAENAQALALAEWLEGNGWADYFLDISDTRGLQSGSHWQAELKKASHRCEAVVVLISRAWNDSRWCLSEFLLAKQLGKTIFGVLIEDIPIDELPTELTSEYQLCNLVDGDARVTFDVEREPLVPPSRVDLPEMGLDDLKRGLQRAGLEATSFPWPPDDEPERAPYRGLKPYEAKDAAIFFGRDALIVRGLDRVRQLHDGIDKLLVILGASGAGKSSFMRAGLWSRLEREDHRFYPLPVVRPGRAAINGEEGLVNCLAAALVDVGVTAISRGEIRTRFKAEAGAQVLMDYMRTLRDALAARAVAGAPEPTFILPIDQGEELYASDGGEEAVQLRVQLSCLKQRYDPAAGAQDGPKLLAMVTIRTDLYGQLQTDELLQDVGRQMMDLTPMDRAEYKRIIEGPAERATVAGNALVIEPALTEQLLTETHGADALPMLAFTLERLYNDYGADGDLTLEEYHRLGGITGSLTAAIDAALDGPLSAPVIPTDKVAQQRLLKQAFIPWLTEVDEHSGERRRRVADWAELPAEAHPMLERLTHARLLVRDLLGEGDARGKREVVEVAHEALLRRWPALVDWLDADQDALKAVGSVSRAAGHWAQNDKHDEYLIHAGERLRYAEGLLEREDFTRRLGTTGRAYLSRCRAVEDERAAKEKKQRSNLRVALVVAVLLAIGASVAAWWGNNKAIEARTAQEKSEEEKERADEERVRAQRALSLMHADLSQQQTEQDFATRGVLLALEALPKSMAKRERPYVRQAEIALHAALQTLRERHILAGHAGGVSSAAFSPDGTRVLTTSSDNTAHLWDATNGTEVAVLDHASGSRGAAFSPDGTRVLTTSSDNTAHLWDPTSGTEVAVLKGHEGEVNGAAFSPDGTRVVTASRDTTARLWDATSGTEVAVLKGSEYAVSSAAFSPDGTRVVTASHDTTARLWDATSGIEVAVLKGHEGAVSSAAFSPDGTRVLTASFYDNTARLWDATSGTEVAVLEGHADAVSSAAFSPDGTRVVTASHDNTARLWDATSGTEVAVLDHADAVNSAAFSPDGTRVVTASSDTTARLWDATRGTEVAVLKGHEGAISSAAFSPDGTRVVTASYDNTARLWDATSGTEVAVLKGHEGAVNSAAFSPDGTRVVTASHDTTARLWDATSGTEVAVLDHADSVNSAAFSPDGTRVATASNDNTARLWDATSGTEVAVLKGHEGAISSAAFSPDGTRVVTASHDTTARLWDAMSGTEVAVLVGHEGAVNSAAFSPDGTRVLTASLQDNTARLWDATRGTEVAVLKGGHEGAVSSAAFSPDGTQVVAASWDATARLWDATRGTEVAVLKGSEYAVSSAAFSPDGTRVVTASYDNTARLWDTTSGTEVAVLSHEGAVSSAAFSPDGTRVLTASFQDTTARLWDATSGTEVAVLKGHEGAVSSAAFSPDGTRVVTASSDNTARLWPVRSTEAWIEHARKRLPRQELNREEKERFFVLGE